MNEMLDEIMDLTQKFTNVKNLGWIENCFKGYGAVGNVFETLIGKPIENFEYPDYRGIEIKTKIADKQQMLHLFSAVPDNDLFEINRLLNAYGISDSIMPEYKTFNLWLFANRKNYYNNYNFDIFVDYENKKVSLLIVDMHDQIVDTMTSWSFDMLEEKIYRKLRYLAFVKAEKKFELGKKYYKYNSICFYRLKNFKRFIELIDNGTISISFCVGIHRSGRRIGQAYNSGTDFSINECYLNLLFDEIHHSS